MEQRIGQELELLRRRFSNLEYREDGRWIRVAEYPLPEGWNRPATDVAFQIPVGYPGTPPYGIYVPSGLLFQGARPDNYTEPASAQPPFGGTWGIFSWTPEDGQWNPTVDLVTGRNLLNWIIGVADRFREGR